MINNQDQSPTPIQVDDIFNAPKSTKQKFNGRITNRKHAQPSDDSPDIEQALNLYGIPVNERIFQLHAIGLKIRTISEAVNDEFKEILNEPTSHSKVALIIQSADAQKVKDNITQSTRAELASHSATLFKRVAKAEESLVETYSNKLIEALELLNTIDITELNEKNQLVNLKKIISVTDIIEKYHAKASKVIGTEALREIETFRAKAQIKQQQENETANLIPVGPQNETKITRFL